jgi:hypothetical protein
MSPARRILVCQCVQEVSTFNPVPSHASDFDVRPRYGVLRTDTVVVR